MGVYIGGGGLRKGINYEKVEWLKNNSVANYMQFSVPSCYLDDIRISAKFDISDQITFRNESHFNFCSTSIGQWHNNFIVIHKKNGRLYLYSGQTHITPISGTVEFTMNGRTVRVNGNDTIREAYTDEINQLVILGSYYYGATGIKTAYFNFYSPGKNIELIPVRLLSDITRDLAIDNKAHSAGECGMIDKISNIFYANAESSSGYIASGEVMDKIIVDKKVKYFAIKNSTNVVYPKKIYWANSRNSVQLVYIRPVKDLHIINPSFYRNFENYVTDISEIRLTSHIPNATEVIDNNIVNITHDNNNRFVKTYMWLTNDPNNVGKYIGYIGSPWYDNNSKFYCHGDLSNCFRNLKVTFLQHIVSKLDTNDVSAIYSMFYGCSKLINIDLSNFDTSKCAMFNGIFSGCLSLQSINISTWNTENVNTFSEMFYNCRTLQHIDLSSFDTRNAKQFDYMFYYCSSLSILDLSNFNTDNLVSCISTFLRCSSLNSIYLNNFNTNSVKNMSTVFEYCNMLKKIVSPTFDLTAMQSDTEMFLSCTSITGGNGTTFNSNYIDSTYARVDGENGLPGYFTDPSTQAKITLMNSKNDGLKHLDYITINDTYTIPTLQGYTAVVTDNNGNTYNDGDTIIITQNITLTFVWSEVNNN